MQSPNILQEVIQILSNPAWSGVGSIAGIIGIPVSIFFSNRPYSSLHAPRFVASPKKSY